MCLYTLAIQKPRPLKKGRGFKLRGTTLHFSGIGDALSGTPNGLHRVKPALLLTVSDSVGAYSEALPSELGPRLGRDIQRELLHPAFTVPDSL